MNILFILNDPPYGTEICYNALRLAIALVKADPEIQLTVFLMADAVTATRRGQKTPDGYYNLERMIKRVAKGNGHVLLCGTCMDARGLEIEEMLDGAQRSTMDELAEGTLATMPEVAASTGSACHSGRVELSPVLEAMGVAPEAGMGAIRFSLGRDTTEEDVNAVGSTLNSALAPTDSEAGS